MQKQGSIVHPLRDLANCSKLRMANVGWAEFKPHLRGSLGHGPNQHKRAVPRRGHEAKSLTSISMLPHYIDGPSTLGLRQQRKISTTPVPCAPHQEVTVKGLEHHRLHEGSVHRKRQKSEKNWRPNPPNRGAETTRWEEGTFFQMQKAK